MRKLVVILMAVAAVAVILGCGGGGSKSAGRSVAGEYANGGVAVDSTYYGLVTKVDMQRWFQMLADGGDTLSFSLPEVSDSDEVIVMGGITVGDRLAVTAQRLYDGSLHATKVINLTTLIGSWKYEDSMLEFLEGGDLNTEGERMKMYAEWRIFNGHLLLSKDTFDIYELTADSLWLEDRDGIYDFERK